MTSDATLPFAAIWQAPCFYCSPCLRLSEALRTRFESLFVGNPRIVHFNPNLVGALFTELLNWDSFSTKEWGKIALG
jgi:hypothetical protein